MGILIDIPLPKSQLFFNTLPGISPGCHIIMHVVLTALDESIFEKCLLPTRQRVSIFDVAALSSKFRMNFKLPDRVQQLPPASQHSDVF
jgi:hypothetical protein